MKDQRVGDTLHLVLDAGGHIVSADAPLARLQKAAGGQADGKLVVPQLAMIGHIAQRMQLLVSRAATAFLDGRRITMWVQARPEAGGIQFAITDWREGEIAPLADGEQQTRAADIALSGEGWAWQVNAELRFAGDCDASDDEAPEAGVPFSAVFDLNAGADEEAPLLSALVAHQAFYARPVNSLRLPERAYLLSGHPIFDSKGTFAGYRGKAALIEAEGQIPAANLAENDVHAALSAVGDLSDFGRRLDVALRRPLGRIIANAETMSSQLEGPLRNDYATYAADIANAGRHLMGLVDDLGDLRAVDRPDFSVAREEVDLADIARRTAGLLSLKAADRHIAITVPTASEKLVAIGEFRRVLQIAVNLVGNAVRYSPEHSSVWVRIEDTGDRAELMVADQGQGIAPEDQDRVFERFERLGREDTGGSGLGLYISRKLARAMGGDIRIDSALGQGARFTLSLPKG